MTEVTTAQRRNDDVADATPAAPAAATKTVNYRIALFNSADPRGAKVGGIETYCRDYIFYHPEDAELLFVGADEVGDLPIGEVSEVEYRGRKIKFLPLYFLGNAVNNYTGTITKSETMTFAKAILKHWGVLRPLLKQGGYTAEVHRAEYAPIIRAMGVPVIPMVHIFGGESKNQSSVLGKYWYIRDLCDFMAAATGYKFYSVNPDMTAMYKKKFPIYAKKFDTLTTWANTTSFYPTPFPQSDHIDILYAGRMDKFKRPDVMFRVLAEAQKLSGKVRFHYVGDGNVEEFPEFAVIRDITVLHGSKTGLEVAELMRQMHIGLLTSDFEGMPRFVLEMLTSGRPVVALHLPQLEPVIEDGRTGFLIGRAEGEDLSAQIAEQARRIVDTHRLIGEGAIIPEDVREIVEPYSPHSLLGKIWADHRAIAEARRR